jgi:RecA-family ATPase
MFQKTDSTDDIRKQVQDRVDQEQVLLRIAAEERSLQRQAIQAEGEKEPETPPDIKLINAATWLDSEPPPSDQIMMDTFDAGDKVCIIGSSKLRKSFFILMMLICLAAGRNFLNWQVVRPRRVLYCQFEIKDQHCHRRVKRMARAMGITAADLGDRLQIINARGLGISGRKVWSGYRGPPLTSGRKLSALIPSIKSQRELRTTRRMQRLS